MSIITKVLKQTAVWWSQGSAAPDEYGQPVVAAPIEIKVRWEDAAEEFIDKDGTKQLTRAVVMVDRDVSVGDVLMLGTLGGVTDFGRAKNNAGAWEVRAFDKLPNLRVSEYLRTAKL